MVLAYPGIKPFKLPSNLRVKKETIASKFFQYLIWKVAEKPSSLVNEVKSLFDFKLKKLGNVNAEAGQFLKFKEYINDGSLIDRGKSPYKLRDNYLGIEIECYIQESEGSLRQSLIDAGLSKYADITGDGSLRPPDGTRGVEVRLLVKESEYKDVLARTFEAINANNASVNHACGVHIHLDMRPSSGRDVAKCYTNLYNAQQHLFSAIPEGRRSNEYCVPNRDSRIQRQTQYMQSSYSGRHKRYAAINTLSVDRHETLEVRVHEGTTDCNRLVHWIDTLLSIINTETIPLTIDLEVFLSGLNNYSDEYKEQYRQRVQQFAS